MTDDITVVDGDLCIANALVDPRDAHCITNNGAPNEETGDLKIDNAQVIVVNAAVDIRDDA